jgi:hypothetical protein
MGADLFLGMVFGAGGMFVFLAFVGAVIWFVWFMINNQLKYVIPITNYTGGQPTVELHLAKKIVDPIKGACYFIPNLKSQKRPYLPFLGSKFEYPLKGGKFFVNFVLYDNEPTAMYFDPLGIELRDVIISYKDMTEEEKSKMTEEEKEYFVTESTPTFKDKIMFRKAKTEDQIFFKVRREVKINCIRPTKTNLRKWVIDNDRQIAHELPQDAGFWEKYGQDIMTFSFIAIVGGVCIFLIIFSYQHADKVLAQASLAPQWAQNFINATQQNISIPKLG